MPPQITRASALPSRTRKHENCIFSFKCCINALPEFNQSLLDFLGTLKMRGRKMRNWKMRHQCATYEGWKLQDWKMQETTLYGKLHITYVSCKVQSTVHTVYCLLVQSRQLPVITFLRSDSSVTFRKWNTLQYPQAEVLCTLTRIKRMSEFALQVLLYV